MEINGCKIIFKFHILQCHEEQVNQIEYQAKKLLELLGGLSYACKNILCWSFFFIFFNVFFSGIMSYVDNSMILFFNDSYGNFGFFW